MGLPCKPLISLCTIVQSKKIPDETHAKRWCTKDWMTAESVSTIPVAITEQISFESISSLNTRQRKYDDKDKFNILMSRFRYIAFMYSNCLFNELKEWTDAMLSPTGIIELPIPLRCSPGNLNIPLIQSANSVQDSIMINY
ncbi:hypothetical protein LOD99_2161 [Oopsacas minuta]|uniref:Uncharacterized protein n=1 Tax=Oopsacas minuta TaxID=111878 RepID=A0AAV7K2B4_9METZ|nr:hypothetical protein LOD99_2161 [Oopsacas minuta]